MYIYVCILYLSLFARIDELLRDMEKSHHILSRWNHSDQEYIELKSIFTKEELHQLAEVMWSASNCRLFLLQLKAKYAGNLNLGGWGTIEVIVFILF